MKARSGVAPISFTLRVPQHVEVPVSGTDGSTQSVVGIGDVMVTFHLNYKVVAMIVAIIAQVVYFYGSAILRAFGIEVASP